MANFANHHTGLKGDSTVIKHLGGVVGLVNPNVALPQIGIAHPAQPLHRHDHRFQMIFSRRVERSQSALAHHTVGRNAVVHLKTLHGGLQTGIESLGEGPIKIAKGNQTVAQCDDVCGAGIGLDFFGRKGGTITACRHNSFKCYLFRHKARVNRGGRHKSTQP